LVSPAGAILAPDLLELIVDEALRARSVLALYTRQTTTGDELRYLQSTVETLAAAPVAAGTAKPVSVLTTAVKSSPVQTIATVSEALDRAVLLDFALFTNWIEGRLRSAVELAIETQTISGSGTAPNLRGILNTAGIGVAGPPTAGQTMADAIAAGLSLLESDEQAASAIVVNPNDYWLMRGVREGTGATAGGYLYGDPAGAGPATLWGVPVVRSTAIAQGSALVGDFRQATLAVREDTTVAWADAHADLFTKNQVVVRVEARIAFFVQRPSAFVNVDLVA
jgi:HK97 family phage major capsid protein